MPRLACPCGYIHDLSPIPDDGWVTVRDRDYDTFTDAQAASRAGDREGSAWLVRLTGRLYECPACGRVMWQRPGDDRFSTFQPETDRP